MSLVLRKFFDLSKWISISAIGISVGLIPGLAGCGAEVGSVYGAHPVRGILVADALGGQDFSLGVANGGLELTEAPGSAGAIASAALVDAETGAHYSLKVTDGVLTLALDPTSGVGTERIKLVDSVTTRTYALAVIAGALTLAPS